MKLEEAKKYLKIMIKTFDTKCPNINERNVNCLKVEAIETVLQALDDKDKKLQEISDEFLKYDWKNSNSIQVNNQLKSLYYSIFRKEGE